MYILGLLGYLLVPILAWYSEGAQNFILTSYSLAPTITIAIGVAYAYPILVFLTGVVVGKRFSITRKTYKSQVILASTIAISLGLVGTFVGLANMVAGIAGGLSAEGDFGTKMAALLLSISVAMDSMSLAFLTSILGVTTSIALLFSGNFIETYFPRDDVGSSLARLAQDELANYTQSASDNYLALSDDLRKTREILTDQSKLWSDLYVMLEARAGENILTRMTESLEMHNRVLGDLSSAIQQSHTQQMRGFEELKTAFLEAEENTLRASEKNTQLLVDQATITREFQSELQSQTNTLIDESSKRIAEVAGILQDIRVAMALPLEEVLAKAIRENTLRLVYQKQVDANQTLVGYETYLRWEDSVRGVISPEQMIQVAREHGLLIDLNKWVFANAIKQVADWQNAGQWAEHMKLSINVSSEFLLSPGFVQFVRQNLQKSHLPANVIAVEVTEAIISADPDSCMDKLAQLKSMGLALYIDDFGTGYTSIKTLDDLQVDVIKIDRGLVDEINTENLSVIRSIMNIAEQLNIQAGCEGVESEEQFAKLRELGCVLFQGYLIGRPVLPAEILPST
jgi:EAL domain-containing protein (putative c-di-GMP-specific phosphodiesterase class I)